MSARRLQKLLHKDNWLCSIIGAAITLKNKCHRENLFTEHGVYGRASLGGHMHSTTCVLSGLRYSQRYVRSVTLTLRLTSSALLSSMSDTVAPRMGRTRYLIKRRVRV